MAPVAVEPNSTVNGNKAVDLKALKQDINLHPFYAPPPGDDGDEEYEYARYKVRITLIKLSECSFTNRVQPRWPKVDWEPLKEFEVVDRGTFVNPADGFKNLLGAATKVTHLTPTIGTEITGLDLRYLTDVQKDEL
jgi:sulfonate dioxygenase